ncbi:hypothetical protein [aff. Roholtiella sp. LEGE 12411]|uniref:hypothetical protein n=1 Tax=aff. Roholtiella sp. LEGE 12411 TaxID=1828822 RepID=UPI0030D7E7EA
MGIGHWALGVGHWTLGIGHLLTLRHAVGRIFNNAHCLPRGIKCGEEVSCRFL